jgi:rieske iron-sulfur protein
MSKFSQERRDALKSTCWLVTVTALASGAGVKAFAAGGAMPLAQATGVPQVGGTFVFSGGPNKGKEAMVADVVLGARPELAVAKNPSTGKLEQDDAGGHDRATVLFYRVAPDAYPADMKDATVEGISCYTAMCPHLGCLVDGWDATAKLFKCPCHEANFDPVKEGQLISGPRMRGLPLIPIKAVDGKLVVAGKPTGYIGVKKG